MRGLKPLCIVVRLVVTTSHPTWVRGLKPRQPTVAADGRRVAPYVGAWIETASARLSIVVVTVAPYVGAWIETLSSLDDSIFVASHPTWVRGLKPNISDYG